MIKSPHFYYRGHEFNPWSGKEDPACHMARAKKKSPFPSLKKKLVFGEGKKGSIGKATAIQMPVP